MGDRIRLWSEYVREEQDRLEARWRELDEAQRQDDYPRAMRRQSRTAAVLALLALVVLVGCYAVVKGGPRP